MIKLEREDLRCHINHDCKRENEAFCELKLGTWKLCEILQDHQNNCAQKYADNCRICDFIKARFAVLFK